MAPGAALAVAGLGMEVVRLILGSAFLLAVAGFAIAVSSNRAAARYRGRADTEVSFLGIIRIRSQRDLRESGRSEDIEAAQGPTKLLPDDASNNS